MPATNPSDSGLQNNPAFPKRISSVQRLQIITPRHIRLNLHFNLPASRAALVNVVAKHVTPEHVFGGDGNEEDCTTEASNAHSEVGEDGAHEARFNGKKTEQKQIRCERKEAHNGELAPLDGERRCISTVIVIDTGRRILLVRRSRLGAAAPDLAVRHSCDDTGTAQSASKRAQETLIERQLCRDLECGRESATPQRRARRICETESADGNGCRSTTSVALCVQNPASGSACALQLRSALAHSPRRHGHRCLPPARL